MTSSENRLRDLLHRLTPEPPSQISAEHVRAAHETITAGLDHADHPARRGRGVRWLAPIAAAVVVAAIAAVVAVVLASTNRSVNPSGEAPPGTTSAPPSTPSTSTAPAGGPPCLAKNLTASVLRRGSTASAPFIIVGLRNDGSTICTLTGYPAISVFSATSRQPLRIAVHHGTYEQPDPGSQRVTLQRNSLAWFAVGTSTAYQGGRNIVTITRIMIALPGAPARQGINLDLGKHGGLGATANPGKAFPVGITAFAAGSGN